MTRPLDPRRLYEQLFAAAPLGVAFLDRNLRYLSVNDVLAEANGSRPADHIGRTVAAMAPELADAVLPRYHRVLDTGEAMVDQEVVQCRDDLPGGRRVWLTSYFPVQDDTGATAGICTVIQDITARKDAEEVLADREAFQSAFLDGMPGYLLLLDEDGRIRRWNRRLIERLNRPAAQLDGLHVVDMVAPADRLKVRRALADCLEEGAVTIEFQYRSRSGGSLPVSGQGVRLELGGRTYVCTLLEDITETHRTRTHLQQQLRFQSLVAQLSAALLTAQAADVYKVLRRHMPEIGAVFGAERLTVWEQDPVADVLRSCATWNAEGVEPSDMDLTSEDFPDATARIRSGESIVFNDLEQGDGNRKGPSRSDLRAQRLRSGLMAPIRVGGVVVTVLAMGTLNHGADWDDDDAERARVVAGVIAGALKRRLSEQALTDAFDRIAQLKDHLEEEYTVLRDEVSLRYIHEEVVGSSQALQAVLFRAEQVAPTDVTVLIQGETGTGKELIARAVHHASRRHTLPLVTVNCAALPASLIESELFGHERGAFTGADARRVGRFEIADGGTFFLDEVGEVPLDLQAKLLRVLQIGEFERLGSSTTLTTDVRIIAATNRDLAAEVAAGRFREDLWYRLNVFPIRVPPLRERREDIPALTAFFLQRLSAKLGRPELHLPRSVLEILIDYDWPGNVRELENVIERGVITSVSDEFRLADPLVARGRHTAPPRLRAMADVEREHLRTVLQEKQWRIEGDGGAAQILGLKPSTLRARLRKHGLTRPKRP